MTIAIFILLLLYLIETIFSTYVSISIGLIPKNKVWTAFIWYPIAFGYSFYAVATDNMILIAIWLFYEFLTDGIGLMFPQYNALKKFLLRFELFAIHIPIAIMFLIKLSQLQ